MTAAPALVVAPEVERTSFPGAFREARDAGCERRDEVVDYIFAHFAAEEINEWLDVRQVIEQKVWALIRWEQASARGGHHGDTQRPAAAPRSRKAGYNIWDRELALRDGSPHFLVREATVAQIEALRDDYAARVDENSRGTTWCDAVLRLAKKHKVTTLAELAAKKVSLPEWPEKGVN